MASPESFTKEKEIEEVLPQRLREEIRELWGIAFEERKMKLLPLDWDAIIKLSPDPVIAWDRITVKRPDDLVVGRFSRVDPNCYISPKLKIGEFSHLAHGCTIGGGDDEVVVSVGNHCGLAAGSRVYAISDDPRADPFSAYSDPLNNLFREGLRGNVTLENYTGVALNSIVLPGTTLKEGSFVVPLSIVPPDSVLEPWTIYGGIGRGFRPIMGRDQEQVLKKTKRIERFAELALEVQGVLRGQEWK